MHQPQPLIWLARSETSSRVDVGSVDSAIIMLAAANRLLNLAPTSFSIMLNLGSMSFFLTRAAGWMTMRCRRPGLCDSVGEVSQNAGARCLVGRPLSRAKRSTPMGSMPPATPDPATTAFLVHRNLLFTVAYEMLGSAADAEDVLQETSLR